jgi:hypothetical protein
VNEYLDDVVVVVDDTFLKAHTVVYIDVKLAIDALGECVLGLD